MTNSLRRGETGFSIPAILANIKSRLWRPTRGSFASVSDLGFFPCFAYKPSLSRDWKTEARNFDSYHHRWRLAKSRGSSTK